MSVISELPRGEMPTEAQDNSLVRLQIGRLALQMSSPDGAALSPAADRPPVRPKADPILLRLRPAPAMLARNADMVALRDAVHAGQVAHLYGAPGMGKTALLSQLAYQVPRTWCPDGAIYLRARYADLSDLMQALYDLLHEPEPTNKPTLGELVAGLKDRQVLLLLDDISLPAEAIQSLVQALSGWRFVLVTTQRLSLRDAYAHSLEGLSPDDALTLVERALGHWVSSAERPMVQRACAALQGNPLFLLQLVSLARKRDWPLFELVTDLASSRAPEALQEQILESLTEPERRVLAALASAEGVPLSVAALGAVTELPQVAPILEELQQQYLIEGQGSLYRVRHPLAVAVRQASDTAPWLWRVLSNTLESLEQGHPLPNDDEVLGGLTLLCGAAARAGWSPEVIRLARAAQGHLALARRWGAWKSVLTYALHASRLASDRASEAWAFHQLGTMAVCLGDARGGRAQLTRALRLRTRESAKTLTEQNLGFFRANAGAQRASPSGAAQDMGSSGTAGPPLLGHHAWLKKPKSFLWLGFACFVVLALMVALWGSLSPWSNRDKTGDVMQSTRAPSLGVELAQPSGTAQSAEAFRPVEATQPPRLPTAISTPQPTMSIPSPAATAVPSPTATVSPQPTAVPTVVYDFIASASRARWRNSVQQVLSFPSGGSMSPGLVRPFEDTLEDGQAADMALETRPNLATRGFIRGYYRQSITVEPGDRFRTWVGFRQGAEGGQVTFRFSFDAGCNGTYDARWELSKGYDSRMAEWIIPLDSLFADKSARGCFALQVDAGESSKGDHAVWVGSRIERQ